MKVDINCKKQQKNTDDATKNLLFLSNMQIIVNI